MLTLFILYFIFMFYIVRPRANAHIVASIRVFARVHPRIRRPSNTRVYRYKFTKIATLFQTFTQ